MRHHWQPLIVVLFALLAMPARAQQESVHWHHDLESAKTVAKETGRLVLVHFWTPSCGPCLALDQNVFNQPGVAASIDAQFVPVKLNADENSATAQWFGITRVPTDVVVTPDGQIVGKLVSPPTAVGYVAEVTGLASKHAAKSGQTFASAAANAPAPSQLNAAYAKLQVAPNTAPPVAQPAVNANNVRNQYAAASFGTAVPATTSPITAPPGLPAAGATNAMTAPPLAAATLPSYNTPRPAALPVNPAYQNLTMSPQAPATPAPAAAPPAVPQTVMNPAMAMNQGPPTAQFPITPVGQPVAAAPPIQVPNPYLAATAAMPPVAQVPAPPALSSVPSTSPYGGAPAPTTPLAQAYAPPVAAAVPPIAAAAASAPASPMTNGSVPDPRQLPPGAPPLAFDGYCPVSMRNSWKWTPGNPQWGIVHLGRTYWFAGAEEQKQFWTDPARYAPALSGMDPVLALDHKQQVPGKREHSIDYDGLFYMFASEATLQQFTANPARYSAGVRQAMGIPRGRLVR